jgi:excisionase family DNA binding protein
VGDAKRMATEPEHFVTADDIAAHLKITRRQVLEMTRRGLIPAHALGVGEHRKVWRFKISEVEAALASNGRKLPAAPSIDNSLAPRSTASTMPVGSSPSQRRKSNG